MRVQGAPTDHSPPDPAWVDSWKNSTPQHTIHAHNLPRDRWVSVEIPADYNQMVQALSSSGVQRILADPQQRNYWIYATGRTLFFFLSSLTSALMQIHVQSDLRPWVSGRSLRTELAAALKRVAMSGERADVRESATRIPDTGARARKLFGSIFELYRRECWHIYSGVYRAPYDASLRHRQFNPFFVRSAFLRTLEANIETGVRRSRGRAGFVEVKKDVLQRSASAGDFSLSLAPLPLTRSTLSLLQPACRLAPCLQELYVSCTTACRGSALHADQSCTIPVERVMDHAASTPPPAHLLAPPPPNPPHYPAESGVVVVDDPFEAGVDLFNDNYLLGNLSQYPNYYLQNFHWQTDG